MIKKENQKREKLYKKLIKQQFVTPLKDKTKSAIVVS